MVLWLLFAAGLLLGSLAKAEPLPCAAASCAPPEVKCAACDAMCDNVEAEIDKYEAEGKTVSAGWRLDSKGSRVQKKLPYGKSEQGVVEIFNMACHKIQNLTESTNGDGTKSLFIGPNEAFKLGGSKLDMYMRTCYDFIETNEEDIATTMIEWDEKDWPPLLRDLKPRLCTELVSVCPKSRWKDRAARGELRI